MGVNKVIYYGEVLVDMSQVTVTPETLGKGATALDAKGDLITGLHECKETEPKLQSKTVTPTTSLQTVNPDSGYDGLSKVTVNAMPTATQATPSITVSSSGLITAKATQSAGYVASGTKQATKQLTAQAAQTITPSTSDKTIASGRYLTGTQTIKGDANLVAGNIKSGVSIFGVTGSYEGSGGGSGGGGSVETCTVTFSGIRGHALFTTLEDGAIEYGTGFLTGNSANIPQVVCKTYMVLQDISNPEYLNIESDAGLSYLEVFGDGFAVINIDGNTTIAL